jgi:hypothetical protein
LSKKYYENDFTLPQMEVESFYGENGFFLGLKSDFRSSFKAVEKTI